jgi:hypothetical protein
LFLSDSRSRPPDSSAFRVGNLWRVVVPTPSQTCATTDRPICFEWEAELHKVADPHDLKSWEGFFCDGDLYRN